MERNSTWAIPISLILLLLLLIYSANAAEDDVKVSLIGFLRKLSSKNSRIDLDFRWNASIDPCGDGWAGVDCKGTNSVQKIVLEGLGLDGPIDAGLLCKAKSLAVLSLRDNELHGRLPPEISNCTELTHLYLGGNRLSGSLPSSLSLLSNLKRLNISYNNFSGELPPDLPDISGLKTILAQNNSFDGTIPQFKFSNLKDFDVSYNGLSGPIPRGADHFGAETFMGNHGLCGEPLPAACPPPPPPPPSPSQGENKSKKLAGETAIMISGYLALALVLLLFFAYKLVYRRKTGAKKGGEEKKAAESSAKSSSGDKIITASRSEYSLPASDESAATASSSLVVLVNPTTKELKFEELLKAPAELLGRGRFGSLYKVMFDGTTALAVKRIKDWAISAEDFRKRMERIDRVKHPNVLSALAFYCSKQEKLVVYEYQKNGSLFKLLRGKTDFIFLFFFRENTSFNSLIIDLAEDYGREHEQKIALFWTLFISMIGWL